MGDPYLVYDKSNIQVDVFHVKEPLTRFKYKKLLHREAYLFNPLDAKKPDLDIKDLNIVKERIYLSDTSEIILQKIAKNCCSDLSGKDIFAWIDHGQDDPSCKKKTDKKKKKPLSYTKPIGIHYNDLEEYMNLIQDQQWVSP